MAVTTTTASNPLVTTVVVDSTADLTVETAASANEYLYAVEIVNPNATEAVYLHLINASSNSTVSTQHTSQFYCPAASSTFYYMPGGYKTTTGIQFYVSTSAGGGNAASAPTDAVTVTLGFTPQ
jgi:hypothetical protein